MTAVKLRRVDDAIGATFPVEVLSRLQLVEGDTLEIIDTAEGILLKRQETDEERALKVARAVMDRNRVVLEALAK